MELYEAIFKRRDIRHFQRRPVPHEITMKILKAAHHAGSVGYMQPWNFVVIESHLVKEQILQVFEKSNAQARKVYTGNAQKLYDSLKLQGIVDAPINIAVTCRHETADGQPVLGRHSIPEMDVYSTCCAIQNLWLAARAEGVGVGWVSILDPHEVKKILKIPESVTLVGYLCLGFPEEFSDQPLLEKVGWRRRLSLDEVIFRNYWDER